MTFPLLPLTLCRVPPGLRLALEQEGLPWLDFDDAPWLTRFVVFDSRLAPAPTLEDGQVALDVAEICRSYPADPCEMLMREDAARFQFAIGTWNASEVVAAVDKRSVRRRLMTELRVRIEQAGGVWMRVGAFPFPYRSAFNFRLDHDACEPADLQRLLQTIRGWEGATTHFLCGSAYENERQSLSLLRGLDVGAHGYWHHTYRDAQANVRNISRCLDLLQQAGLDAQGFVAPHGRYNAGLRSALNELRVPYSSEFALAYDELPFFPAGSQALQVPVHPVSLGIVLEAAGRSAEGEDAIPRAVEAAVEYFASMAQQKYMSGEPVFLYGHPDRRLGRYPQVLQHVLATVNSLSAIWKTTLREFVRWWRVRRSCSFRVYQDQSHFLVVADRRPRGFVPAIELWRGEHVAVLPLDGPLTRASLESLAFQRRPTPSDVSRPVRVDQRPTLRGRFKRYIDWEKATPPGEIEIRSFRDLMKKTLRLIHR